LAEGRAPLSPLPPLSSDLVVGSLPPPTGGHRRHQWGARRRPREPTTSPPTGSGGVEGVAAGCGCGMPSSDT
jgi:hypothetical protein